MIPEQAREAGSVDARADVFSVGCVLFVALTGAPPFRADTALAMLTKLLFDEAPRARERAPDVPPLLDAIVARMMGKDPERRYASASDARDALERARSSARGLTEPVLSHREARLFSILLAQVPGPDLGGARRAELSLVARRFGGTPEALANGALAVRWSDGDAKEQADARGCRTRVLSVRWRRARATGGMNAASRKPAMWVGSPINAQGIHWLAIS